MALREILDLARWAPSGDNEQPWQFEILSETHGYIHIRNRVHSVYDPERIATDMATGALIETLCLAAQMKGYEANVQAESVHLGDHRTFSVVLNPSTLPPSSLAAMITKRQTSRIRFQKTPLTAEHKHMLQTAVGDNYHLLWIEGSAKRRTIRSIWYSERIRLQTPEIMQAYAETIEWGVDRSATKMPWTALGLNPVMKHLFRQLVHYPTLMRITIQYLGGQLASFFELGILPSLGCAAQFAMVERSSPRDSKDFIAAGRALQRLWLTATHLGILHQPNFTPVAMQRWREMGHAFSKNPASMDAGQKLLDSLTPLIGEENLPKIVWMGRLGYGKAPSARSVRMPLADLLLDASKSA